MEDISILRRSGKIIYKKLTKKDRDISLVVAARALSSEPLTLAYFQKRKVKTSAFLNWIQFIELFMDEFISLGLSVVAIEETTNRIVGVSLVLCIGEGFEEGSDYSNYNAGDNLLRPVNQISEEISLKALEIMSELKESKVADIFLIGVLDEFRGNKICNNLCDLTNLLAKENGYKYTVLEATNHYTSLCCQLLNFSQVCSTEVRNWQWDGENVFEHVMEPHLNIIFWVKDVSSYERLAN